MPIVLLCAGFILLIKGADWFVGGASSLAKKMGIPPLVVGLTIVAFGTSAPEAAVSITAAIRGTADIAIGNVVGSNIANIALIIGITALIMPLAVQESTIKKEIPFTIASTVLLLGLVIKGRLGFWDGIALLGFFLIFLFYLWGVAKKGKLEQEEIPDIDSIPKSLFWMIVGLAGIVLGSDWVIKGSTEIAKWFGMSERFIGLTIVSFGTSLPELVTSVTAALKKEDDIAVGNIVGSNIFNLLFVLGLTSLVTTVPFQMIFIKDIIISIVLLVVLIFFSSTGRKISRIEGGIFATFYAGYIIYLLK